MAKRVHAEDGRGLWSLSTHFLVQCPRCHAQAQVVRRPHGVRSAQLTCEGCGLVKRTFLKGWTENDLTDWFFHLPLWLQTQCCGRVLWAYNLEHVGLMESYVSADLRQRRRDPQHGWANRSLESRLPRWMVLARNRRAVLKGLRQLRELSCSARRPAPEARRVRPLKARPRNTVA